MEKRQKIGIGQPYQTSKIINYVDTENAQKTRMKFVLQARYLWKSYKDVGNQWCDLIVVEIPKKPSTQGAKKETLKKKKCITFFWQI